MPYYLNSRLSCSLVGRRSDVPYFNFASNASTQSFDMHEKVQSSDQLIGKENNFTARGLNSFWSREGEER